MPYEFDVFLSHNSKDKPAVEIIAKKLKEAYGLKCWLDKWNLVPGKALASNFIFWSQRHFSAFLLPTVTNQ